MHPFFAFVILSGTLFLLGGCGDQSHLNRSPSALLKSGAEMASRFAFYEAEEKLRAAREAFPPGSEGWQEASYLLAVSLRHQTPITARKIGEARETLEGLLERVPDSALAPEALMLLARMDELRNFPGDPTDVEAAAARYRLLLEQFPESDLADLAVLRLAAQGTLDPANMEAARSSVAMIEERIAARPNSPYLWPMWEFVASTHLLLFKDNSAALRAMIEADKHSRLNEGRRGNLFWNIAVLAEETGDRATAKAYYRRLFERAKRSPLNTEAKLRLEALEAADGGQG